MEPQQLHRQGGASEFSQESKLVHDYVFAPRSKALGLRPSPASAQGPESP